MTWYYYLNYLIYRYYDRKRDNMPSFFSFWATVILLACNILSILGVIGFFVPIFETSHKLYVLLTLGILSLFNYTLLYRNNYHKEVFAKFDKAGNKYENWNRLVATYIIGSIVFLLIVLALSDYFAGPS